MPLLSVRKAELTDEPSNAAKDHLVQLAVELLGVPAGFMTLIEDEGDSYQCVFQSVVGLDGNLRGRKADDGSRDFFARAFPSVQPCVIENGNEPFLKALGARAFLGVPLLSADRHRVGSLCALDSAPRKWSDRDAWTLSQMASLILAEMRHQRALEAARIALRSREAVLSTVAHDLRSPLTSVILGLELLNDARLNEKERERLAVTREVTESINAMVGDLIQMSELDSGTLMLSAHHVDPGALVEDAVSVLRPVAERNGIRLTARAPSSLTLVKVDYGKILRAFTNLIGNALKFTPRGGAVTVEAEATSDGARFSVRDTGKGISETDMSHIFGAFWRADKREPGGLGLGLSIVKSIVEAHGGEVGVESVLGDGSNFWFRLPGGRSAGTPRQT